MFVSSHFLPCRPKGFVLWFLSTTCLSLALAVPAWAAPATQQGAQQIIDGLEHYLGKSLFEKGVVTVAPHGDGYELKYDLDSARLAWPADRPQVRFGPYVAQLTPKDDGTYAVTSDVPSLTLSYKGAQPGPAVEFTEIANACVTQGVFDPKLMYFTSQTSGCDGAVMTVHTPREDIDATFGKLTMQGGGKPGGNGGVDIDGSADLLDIGETVTVRDPAHPQPPVVMHARHAHEQVSINGARVGDILEALGVLIARGSPDETAAALDDVKAKIKTALPLWQDFSSDISNDDINVTLPAGTVRIANVDHTVTGSGLVKQGRLATGVKFSGLQLPDGLMPAWVKSLAPANGAINLKLSGIDLDAIANQLIEGFDSSSMSQLHDTIQSFILAMLTSGQQLHLDFDESVAASGYDMKGQGGMSVLPSQQGNASISLAGIDNILASLNPARGTAMQRALLGLTYLKGLAKIGPDGRSTWDVGFDSATRKVTVNGQAFGRGAR